MKALLFTGGVDSTCLALLHRDAQRVYVNTQAPYQQVEHETVERFDRSVQDGQTTMRTGGPNLTLALDDATGHVAHRNLALLVTVAAVTGADEILLGAVLGEASNDKSAAFLRAASRALSESEGRRIAVLAPAMRMTKTGLVRHTLRTVSWSGSLIGSAWSCYYPRAYSSAPCGDCQACFRKAVAMFHAGLTDRHPRLPSQVDPAAARSALLGTSATRWPGMLWNNTLAGMALTGIRLPGGGA